MNARFQKRIYKRLEISGLLFYWKKVRLIITFSTLRKTIITKQGIHLIVPVEYPDWYGLPEVGFIWHGAWADPELEYKGKEFNSHIVEDTMWERYNEYCEENDKIPDYDDFAKYMTEHEDEVYELLDLVVEGIESEVDE